VSAEKSDLLEWFPLIEECWNLVLHLKPNNTEPQSQGPGPADPLQPALLTHGLLPAGGSISMLPGHFPALASDRAASQGMAREIYGNLIWCRWNPAETALGDHQLEVRRSPAWWFLCHTRTSTSSSTAAEFCQGTRCRAALSSIGLIRDYTCELRSL
jgi:hypothetical protein